MAATYAPGTTSSGVPYNSSPSWATPSTTPSRTDSNSYTRHEYDPTQEFITQLIGQMYQTGNGTVSPTVTAGIDKMISEPGAVGSIAGKDFAAIAQPLLEQQQAGFKIQNQNTSDMFRKAGVGSMQSGAFAQAVRQQAADQGRQQNALLASSYVPLASNISNNVLGGINAGVKVPGANMDSLSGILTALGRSPTATMTAQSQTTAPPPSGPVSLLPARGESTMPPVSSPSYPEWMAKGYATP
jgi:hypothetical protein